MFRAVISSRTRGLLFPGSSSPSSTSALLSSSSLALFSSIKPSSSSSSWLLLPAIAPALEFSSRNGSSGATVKKIARNGKRGKKPSSCSEKRAVKISDLCCSSSQFANCHPILDESLGKFIVEKSEAQKQTSRHVKTGRFPLRQTAFVDHVSDIIAKFPATTSTNDHVSDCRNDESTTTTFNQTPVVIVNGASGSGKTVSVLQVAKATKENVVFYFTAKNIVAQDASAAHLLFDEGHFEKCYNRAQLKSSDETIVEYKQQRDAAVKEAVTSKVLELLGRETLSPDPDAKIYIVIDEVGPFPHFLRGLCSVAETLGFDLFQLLSAQNRHRGCVQFIATGTGSSYNTVSPGSSPDTYQILCLEKTSPDLPRTVFRETVVLPRIDGYVKFPSERDRRLLLRLLPNDNGDRSQLDTSSTVHNDDVAIIEHEPLSLLEETAKQLISNPRCAMFLLNSLLVAPKVSTTTTGHLRSSHLWSSSIPAFRNALAGAIQAAIESYVNVNGLKSFENTSQLLLTALAISMYRLPCLPVAAKEVNNSFLRQSVKIRPNGTYQKLHPTTAISLYDVLSTQCGILVDTATSPDNTNNEFNLDPFIPEKDRSAASSNKQAQKKTSKTTTAALVLSHETGGTRYHFSPAHVAMLRSHIGLSLRPDGWAGFESNVMDFCTLCVACSSAANTLRSAVEASLRSNDKNNNNNSDDSLENLEKFHYECNAHFSGFFRDPLYPLKKLLLFENFRRESSVDSHSKIGVSKVQSILLGASASSLQLINHANTMGRNSQEDFSNVVNQIVARAVLFNKFLRDRMNDDQSCGLVLQCPDMEQFADGIVVGPGRVLLLQMKQKLGPDEIYLEQAQQSKDKNNEQEETVYTLRKKVGEIDWGDELVKMNVCIPTHANYWYESVWQLKKKILGSKIRDLWLAAILHAANGNKKNNGEEFLSSWRINNHNTTNESDFVEDMKKFELKNHFNMEEINKFFPTEAFFKADNKGATSLRCFTKNELCSNFRQVEVHPIFIVEVASERYETCLRENFETTQPKLKFENKENLNFADPKLITILRPSNNKKIIPTSPSAHPFFPIPVSSNTTNKNQHQLAAVYSVPGISFDEIDHQC